MTPGYPCGMAKKKVLHLAKSKPPSETTKAEEDAIVKKMADALMGQIKKK